VRDTTTNRVLATVRDLMPPRAISLSRAYFVAEQQTRLLLRLLDIHRLPVDVGRFGRLPRVQVGTKPAAAMDGKRSWSRWHRGKWEIAVCADDPLMVRRYNLSCEVKRVLDHTTANVVYSNLRHRHPKHYERLIDSIGSHFAACLLVPGHALRRLWAAGLRDLECLAELFRVPVEVMERRVAFLGLSRNAGCVSEQMSGLKTAPTTADEPAALLGRMYACTPRDWDGLEVRV